MPVIRPRPFYREPMFWLCVAAYVFCFQLEKWL
jgi:hypothetical protein